MSWTAAFSDSVDHALATSGICGEKTVTLDPASMPTFLSYDPAVQEPIAIVYTETTDDADRGTHIVNYSVAFKEYPSNQSISGSFTFEIECPASYDYPPNIVQPTQDEFEYDMAFKTAPLSIPIPAVTLSPGNCFSILSIEVIDEATGI